MKLFKVSSEFPKPKTVSELKVALEKIQVQLTKLFRVSVTCWDTVREGWWGGGIL